MSRYARIIPRLKMPRQRDFFDYEIPEELVEQIGVGTLVNVPFKNKSILGVVHSLVGETKFEKAKKITSVYPNICLTAKELAFIEWFGRNYATSLASTLKLYLPDIPKRATKRVFDYFKSIPVQATAKAALAEEWFRKIIGSKHQQFLLFPHNERLKQSLYLELCGSAIKEGRTIVILFPQLGDLNVFCALLPEFLRNEAVVLTNELYSKKNSYFVAWQKIHNGEVRIILGTRSAILAPLEKVDYLIIDQAHSSDYKQWDQNPRYDTIAAAREWQKLSNCRLVLSSVSPRIEDAYIAKQENYQLIQLGEAFVPSLKTVDMVPLRRQSFTYLGQDLVAMISEPNRKSLVIVNKKNFSSSLICQDCGHEFKCEVCDLPLALQANSLACNHGHRTIGVPTECSKCHSRKLKTLGIGIEKIKQELREQYKLSVAICPDDHDWSTATVVLSTGQDLSQLAGIRFDVLAFAYVDSLLFLPDFNTNFRLYSYLKNITHLCAQANPELRMIIQSLMVANPVIRKLALPYQDFYREEIASREMFGYPPFQTLLKIFFEHQDKKICEREANELYQKLVDGFPEIRLTEPYMHYTQMVRSRYRCQIAVFLPSDQSLETCFIGQIPEYWHIDKMPISLL